MGLDGQFADLAKRICMVTVTYGDRFGFLRQVVEAALANGVGNVLVVDNASAPESRRAIQDLKRRSEGRVAIAQ